MTDDGESAGLLVLPEDRWQMLLELLDRDDAACWLIGSALER